MNGFNVPTRTKNRIMIRRGTGIRNSVTVRRDFTEINPLTNMIVHMNVYGARARARRELAALYHNVPRMRANANARSITRLVITMTVILSFIASVPKRGVHQTIFGIRATSVTLHYLRTFATNLIRQTMRLGNNILANAGNIYVNESKSIVDNTKITQRAGTSTVNPTLSNERIEIFKFHVPGDSSLYRDRHLYLVFFESRSSVTLNVLKSNRRLLVLIEDIHADVGLLENNVIRHLGRHFVGNGHPNGNHLSKGLSALLANSNAISGVTQDDHGDVYIGSSYHAGHGR